jgi:phage-related protein
MAEKSSELDNLTERDTAEATANELGASTTYATTALDAAGDNSNRDMSRDMSSVDKDAEYKTPTTGGATEVDTTQEPEEIKAQIEQTRSDMSETINAIQEKLSFSNLMESAKEEVGEQISGAYKSAKNALFGTAAETFGGFMAKVNKSINQFTEDYGPAISDASRTVVRTAKSNPVPFVLIGLGFGMLIFSSRTEKRKVKSYRYYNEGLETENLDYQYSGSERRRQQQDEKLTTKISDKASQIYEKAADTAEDAYSSVSQAASSAYQGLTEAAGTAYEKVGDYSTQAARGVKNAANWTAETYQNQIEENPLAVGAVAAILGAAIGFALPATEIEAEYLGEHREQLLQKAKDAAGGLVEKAKTLAGDVIEKAQDVAGEAVQSAKDEAKAQGFKA